MIDRMLVIVDSGSGFIALDTMVRGCIDSV